ncbi:MAG TPA: hypothetical protein VIO57_12515 [Chloroflexota bacterium]
MDAEEELMKETVRAFKAGLHGEEYDNPFTEAEEAAGQADSQQVEPERNKGEDGR